MDKSLVRARNSQRPPASPAFAAPTLASRRRSLSQMDLSGFTGARTMRPGLRAATSGARLAVPAPAGSTAVRAPARVIADDTALLLKQLDAARKDTAALQRQMQARDQELFDLRQHMAARASTVQAPSVAGNDAGTGLPVPVPPPPPPPPPPPFIAAAPDARLHLQGPADLRRASSLASALATKADGNAASPSHAMQGACDDASARDDAEVLSKKNKYRNIAAASMRSRGVAGGSMLDLSEHLRGSLRFKQLERSLAGDDAFTPAGVANDTQGGPQAVQPARPARLALQAARPAADKRHYLSGADSIRVRAQLGITQELAARACGVSVESVRSCEDGLRDPIEAMQVALHGFARFPELLAERLAWLDQPADAAAKPDGDTADGGRPAPADVRGRDRTSACLPRFATILEEHNRDQDAGRRRSIAVFP